MASRKTKKTSLPNQANKVVPAKKPAVLTVDKLAKLSCLLACGNNENEDSSLLVRRAMEIWNAAKQALDPKSPEVPVSNDGSISFADIAEHKLLAKIRGEDHIDSRTGVKKAVKIYFDRLNAEFDEAFSKQFIPEKQQMELKKLLLHVTKKWMDVGGLPERILDAMKQFHLKMREDDSYKLSASDIRKVLGGVDIGRAELDLERCG